MVLMLMLLVLVLVVMEEEMSCLVAALSQISMDVST